jgi:hypothetical protein
VAHSSSQGEDARATMLLYRAARKEWERQLLRQAKKFKVTK